MAYDQTCFLRFYRSQDVVLAEVLPRDQRNRSFWESMVQMRPPKWDQLAGSVGRISWFAVSFLLGLKWLILLEFVAIVQTKEKGQFEFASYYISHASRYKQNGHSWGSDSGFKDLQSHKDTDI